MPQMFAFARGEPPLCGTPGITRDISFVMGCVRGMVGGRLALFCRSIATLQVEAASTDGRCSRMRTLHGLTLFSVPGKSSRVEGLRPNFLARAPWDPWNSKGSAASQRAVERSSWKVRGASKRIRRTMTDGFRTLVPASPATGLWRELDARTRWMGLNGMWARASKAVAQRGQEARCPVGKGTPGN